MDTGDWGDGLCIMYTGHRSAPGEGEGVQADKGIDTTDRDTNGDGVDWDDWVWTRPSNSTLLYPVPLDVINDCLTILIEYGDGSDDQ